MKNSPNHLYYSDLTEDWHWAVDPYMDLCFRIYAILPK